MKKKPKYSFTRVVIKNQSDDHEKAVRAWCREQFGPARNSKNTLIDMTWYAKSFLRERHEVRRPSQNVTTYWSVFENELRFYFRNPEHATLFTLRWL